MRLLLLRLIDYNCLNSFNVLMPSLVTLFQDKSMNFMLWILARYSSPSEVISQCQRDNFKSWEKPPIWRRPSFLILFSPISKIYNWWKDNVPNIFIPLTVILLQNKFNFLIVVKFLRYIIESSWRLLLPMLRD